MTNLPILDAEIVHDVSEKVLNEHSMEKMVKIENALDNIVSKVIKNKLGS